MSANAGFTMGYKQNRPQLAVAVVFVSLLLILTGDCLACFSIVVGKDASVEGCVLVGHNEDDTAPQIVNHHKLPMRRHAPGETVRLRNGGSLAQAGQTWACLWSEMPGMLFSDSYLNEWGVTVTSDNCPSREDRPERTDGGIGYMLRRLVAERARSAREGVRLAGRLVDRFGYIDSGRTYIIADPNEGWLFAVANGKHWLARRVPDDEVAMVANTYTIREVDLADRTNFLASADIIDYARSRRWYDPAVDGPFDFARAYANPQAASNPNNSGRQRGGLNYVAREPMGWGQDLPFSVSPRRKLSALDLMQILRHDKDSGVEQGPSNSPFVCALCSGATQTSFVAQLRNGMARDVGLVYWVSLASPRTSFYIPFHFGISDFPSGWRLESRRPSREAYDRRVRAPFTAAPQEAFWMFSNFRDTIERRGPGAVAALQGQARRIERDAATMQIEIEKAALDTYGTDQTMVPRLLENFSKGIYRTCMEVISGDMDAALRKEADRLAREILLLDTHMDTPWQLQEKMQDVSGRIEGGHFDYVRARQGGLDAAFWAVYVPPEYEEKGGAGAFADETLDMLEGLFAKWPDRLVRANSPEEVRAQFGGERVSIVLGMENGAPLKGDLGNVRRFYERGIRYITLAHSRNNHICDSSFDQGPKWHGLSPFGKELVAEMNRLGMLIDVSHVSDDAFYQVLELSRAPVAATHSGCRHFTPGWHRNMSDDMIRRLAEKGGVIQINFGSIFVNPAVNAEFTALRRDIREQVEANGLQGQERDRYVERRWRQAKFGRAYISDVVAHIDHVARLVGVDYVGLGSDFDGVAELPEGLEDVSGYRNLIFELLKLGYSRQDLRKICAGNFLRVWAKVEGVATGF